MQASISFNYNVNVFKGKIAYNKCGRMPGSTTKGNLELQHAMLKMLGEPVIRGAIKHSENLTGVNPTLGVCTVTGPGGFSSVLHAKRDAIEENLRIMRKNKLVKRVYRRPRDKEIIGNDLLKKGPYIITLAGVEQLLRGTLEKVKMPDHSKEV